MFDEQARLDLAFPAFIESVTASATIEDIHIMVVDTSGGLPFEGQPPFECSPDIDCCDALCLNPDLVPKKPCSANGAPALSCQQVLTGMPPSACDMTLGAGRIAHGVDFDRCPDLDDDARYLSEAPPTSALHQRFSCMSHVGIGGLFEERTMDAMQQALALSEQGSCNEGFLRDDALLAVTFITDSADIYSSGTPADWHAALLNAKGGNPDAVVVLGIYGSSETVPDTCGATKAPLQQQFMELFGDQGVSCSVCADDYRPCFQDASERIRSSCTN